MSLKQILEPCTLETKPDSAIRVSPPKSASTDTKRAGPANRPAGTSPKTATVLHLSDLQFGKNHQFADIALDSLFDRLAEDLNILAAQGVVPEIIIVSGDLAEWAEKSEFSQALTFLEKLAEHTGVPKSRIISVTSGFLNSTIMIDGS